jgi:hypothetical protein
VSSHNYLVARTPILESIAHSENMVFTRCKVQAIAVRTVHTWLPLGQLEQPFAIWPQAVASIILLATIHVHTSFRLLISTSRSLFLSFRTSTPKVSSPSLPSLHSSPYTITSYVCIFRNLLEVWREFEVHRTRTQRYSLMLFLRPPCLLLCSRFAGI